MVVSNATPLIYLAKANYLPLLRKTYGEIYVCTEVWREVIYPISLAGPVPKDVPIILQARAEGWLKIRDAETMEAIAIRDELLAQGFGRGESNSIALAKELNTLLLANDEDAIKAAKKYSVETRWVTEILHDALKNRCINSLEEYLQILDACIAEGLLLSCHPPPTFFGNEIIGNSIENNRIGIFATGGSSDNRILLNDFINNEEQVNIPPFTNFWMTAPRVIIGVTIRVLTPIEME